MNHKGKPNSVDDVLSRTHRTGSHSDDWGGDSDNPCFCTVKAELSAIVEQIVYVDGGKEYTARAGDLAGIASSASMNGLRKRQIEKAKQLGLLKERE